MYIFVKEAILKMSKFLALWMYSCIHLVDKFNLGICGNPLLRCGWFFLFSPQALLFREIYDYIV